MMQKATKSIFFPSQKWREFATIWAVSRAHQLAFLIISSTRSFESPVKSAISAMDLFLSFSLKTNDISRWTTPFSKYLLVLYDFHAISDKIS